MFCLCLLHYICGLSAFAHPYHFIYLYTPVTTLPSLHMHRKGALTRERQSFACARTAFLAPHSARGSAAHAASLPPVPQKYSVVKLEHKSTMCRLLESREHALGDSSFLLWGIYIRIAWLTNECLYKTLVEGRFVDILLVARGRCVRLYISVCDINEL